MQTMHENFSSPLTEQNALTIILPSQMLLCRDGYLGFVDRYILYIQGRLLAACYIIVP